MVRLQSRLSLYIGQNISLVKLDIIRHDDEEGREDARDKMSIKVLRPSGPNYWKNVEWIPYVFSKEYCQECETNRVMEQQFGTITFCRL